MYIFRQFATNVSLYPLLWDDEINNGLSLSNLISLCSHENNDIAAAVIQTLYELVDQVNFGFHFPCPSSPSIQPVRPARTVQANVQRGSRSPGRWREYLGE